jgi:membrane protease YdiL (CAAX protease family)
MKTKSLIPFLAISFGLTWGLAALLFFFYDQVVAIFGEVSMSNPLFILAVYAPGFAGVLVILGNYGLKGLGGFFKRLTLVRMPVKWWLYLLLGIPALVYAGAALKGTISDPFPFTPWAQVFPAIALAMFLGPIEEFGWRGIALPLLQRKYSPFWAGLILGVIWAAWHIPSFFIGGTPQSNWSFVPYFLGIITISVIMTPLFNAARGSLLISALYHFQMMNPIFPDAQPWDSLVFFLAAIVIVWLNRRTMFRRGEGITEVLMPDPTEARRDGKRNDVVQEPFAEALK